MMQPKSVRALSIGLWITVGLAACGNSGPKTADAVATVDTGMQRGGRSGNGMVAGGVIASSPNFRLVGTLSTAEGAAASPSFKARTGVVGVTQ